MLVKNADYQCYVEGFLSNDVVDQNPLITEDGVQHVQHSHLRLNFGQLKTMIS